MYSSNRRSISRHTLKHREPTSKITHVVVVLLSIFSASGGAIQLECGNGSDIIAVEENSSNFTLTCSGYSPKAYWTRRVPGYDVQNIGSCSELSCQPDEQLDIVMTYLSRGSSSITICYTTRVSGHSAYNCTANGVSLSCQTNIFVKPTLENPVVIFNATDNWTIKGIIQITRIYSSLRRYECQWKSISSPFSESGKLVPSILLLTPSPEDLQNKGDRSGTCSFRDNVTNYSNNIYKFTVLVTPGGVPITTGTFEIVRPLTPNTICSTTNIPENSTSRCTCRTQNVGKPGGRLMWIKGRDGILNQIINVGSYDVSTLEMEPQRLTRNDDGTQFQCVVDWATNVTGVLHTFNVNYGPDRVQIPENTTFYTNINGTLELRLTCQVIAAKPLSGIVYSWTGPCFGVTNTSCTFRPHPPGNTGISNEVKCTARNPFNNNFLREATFTVDLKYPPLQRPEIIGYPQDLIIYAYDILTLSCSINGGNPIASTTTLACLPYARNVSTGKTAIISFNVPEGVDRLECNCSGMWVVPDFYPLNSKVQFSVYYRSYVSNLTLSGIPDVLIINESSVQVQLLCVARGRPTPEIRLIQEGQRELIRQTGGNIEKDQASLSYQVSSNCESTGRYNCETNNRIGEPDVAHVWFYVQCAPRSVSNTNTAEIPSVNFKGSARNLSFDVISFPCPNQFSFVYKGTSNYTTTTQLPARGDIFEISCSAGDVLLERVQCTLTVDNVNDGDKGYYEVIVINSFGNMSFLFRLAINEIEPSELQKDNSATDDKTAIVAGVSVAATIIIIVTVVVTVFVIRRKRILLNKDGTREPDRTQIAKIDYNVNDPLSQLKDTVDNTAKAYDSLCMQDVGISSPYDEINRYELCSQAVNNQGISPISSPIYENNCNMEHTA